MRFNNRIFSKLAIASILLLVIVHGVILVLNFNDLFYLNKIVAGEKVSASEHAFYIQKANIEYWTTNICFWVYMILFLTWFYRAYSNVYLREPGQAPFKRALVPFSMIIPIMNFYAPYQIMKFIWWGNASSVGHLDKGYKTVKLWWGITLISFILSRVYAYKLNSDTLYAADYINLTYLSMAISIIASCGLLLARKLILDIWTAEKASALH
jgi:hypothetical protein